MSRTTPLLRTVLLGTVGLGAAALLTGCFGPGPIAPVETPRPEATGFATIGDGEETEIETGQTVAPTAAPVAGYTTLADDLNVLTLQVPAEWTDVDGAPYTTEGGQEWASLIASTDIEGYFTTFDVSGVEFAGTPAPDGLTDADLTGFLDSITGFFLDGCDILEQGTAYDDGFYVGFQSGFENCGGTGTEGFGIVALDNAGTHVVYVLAQIAGDDDPSEVYDVITGSFQSSITRAAAK